MKGNVIITIEQMIYIIKNNPQLSCWELGVSQNVMIMRLHSDFIA